MPGRNAHIGGHVPALSAWICAAVALACALLPAPAAAAQSRAETVADLARFAVWPEEAEHGLSFRICLRDDDPAFGEFVRLRGQRIGGRPITLHAVAPEAIAERPCHVSYFSAGYVQASVLQRLRHQPVMTVSPERGFAAAGGLVELRFDGQAMALVVDRAAVRRHPIEVSAQLLDLASEASR